MRLLTLCGVGALAVAAVVLTGIYLIPYIAMYVVGSALLVALGGW